MFQNTNVLFLNTFNAILNIMDANARVLSVKFIYSVWWPGLWNFLLMFSYTPQVLLSFFPTNVFYSEINFLY